MCIKLCDCSSTKQKEEDDFLIADNNKSDSSLKTAAKVFAGVGVAMALSMAAIKAVNMLEDADIESPRSDVGSEISVTADKTQDLAFGWFGIPHWLPHLFHIHDSRHGPGHNIDYDYDHGFGPYLADADDISDGGISFGDCDDIATT